MVLRAVSEWLATHEHLDVSLLSLKSWPRRDRKEIGRNLRQWGKRFSAQRSTTPIATSMFCHANDWIALPATRATFGIHAAHALACGTPVIANRIEPFGELVENGVNGFLVPCETHLGTAHAPIATPDYGEWLQLGRTLFAETTALFRLQMQNWKVAQNRNTFENVWKNEFNA